jgi:hypothetical protein
MELRTPTVTYLRAGFRTSSNIPPLAYGLEPSPDNRLNPPNLRDVHPLRHCTSTADVCIVLCRKKSPH